MTTPVRLEGELDPHLSRGLWLVKWLLALPHLVVLACLWLAYVVTWLISLVTIVATGRYPRGLFEFHVGVLRWTWRVGFYAVGTLGTDRYPPFSLRDDPAYPARLTIAYPERLSRGLALVKWWVLAIPQYLVVGAFLGGSSGSDRSSTPGLASVLVLCAAVALLFTGRYPRTVFDFVMGLHRWAFRVAAYASLMTDDYPPFRLDMGGQEPAPETPEATPGGHVDG